MADNNFRRRAEKEGSSPEDQIRNAVREGRGDIVGTLLRKDPDLVYVGGSHQYSETEIIVKNLDKFLDAQTALARQEPMPSEHIRNEAIAMEELTPLAKMARHSFPALARAINDFNNGNPDAFRFWGLAQKEIVVPVNSPAAKPVLGPKLVAKTTASPQRQLFTAVAR